MTIGRVEKRLPEPAAVAAKYETLRLAGLGEALPPEARSGLMLFLNRGLWGWARTLVPASARQELTDVPSPAPTTPGDHAPVIHLLAAIALNVNFRRAP